MEKTIHLSTTTKTRFPGDGFALGETLYTAVAEWLETGEVDVSKYPIKYVNAIISQENKGWRHFFDGKISQE
jgi:hypothetical protein